MSDLIVVNCPHCTIECASDGCCHNHEQTNARGVNYSCEPCTKAAEKTGEKSGPESNFFIHMMCYELRAIVTCRICRGMKKVFVNPNTREILPFVISGSEE